MKQNLELNSTSVLAHISFAKRSGPIYNLLDNDDLVGFVDFRRKL